MSVAVTVWLPAVFKVTLNVPTPLSSVTLAGSVAAPSLLVKWTVPVYPVAVLLFTSSAVTWILKAAPAVAAGRGRDDEVRGRRRHVDGAGSARDRAADSVGGGDRLAALGRNTTLKVAVPLVKSALAGSAAAPSLLVKWTVPA